MVFTNDQYEGLSKLNKWYDKYNHQCIKLCNFIGTGAWELIQSFISASDLQPYEVAYLSYDQRHVMDLALYQYHAYYINRFIYNYIRITNLDTLPVFSNDPRAVSEYHWEKSIKKKIAKKYKLLVVFDATLMDEKTLDDLMSFNIPIILVYDPILLPNIDSPIYNTKPNIILKEINNAYVGNPLVLFAYRILSGERLKVGSYDNVNVVSQKNMNVYNLKSSNMNLTISNTLMNETNAMYRNIIQKNKTGTNRLGDRLILTKDLYDKELVNNKEKRIRLYMTKGLVGKITKLNRHVQRTKYLPIEFTTDFYKTPFTEIVMDRHYLNKIEFTNRQLVPEDIAYFDYAFSLSVEKARIGYWDKVTLLADENEYNNEELQKRLMYTAINKTKYNLTIVI